MAVWVCTILVHDVAVQYGMVLAWANNPIRCRGFAGARASRGRGIENRIFHIMKLPTKGSNQAIEPFYPYLIP